MPSTINRSLSFRIFAFALPLAVAACGDETQSPVDAEAPAGDLLAAGDNRDLAIPRDAATPPEGRDLAVPDLAISTDLATPADLAADVRQFLEVADERGWLRSA